MKTKEQKNEYAREYYKKNREKLLEYRKHWNRKTYGYKKAVIKNISKTNTKERRRKINKKNKEIYLKKTYNIGLEEYNLLFYRQEGKCAICGIHQTKIERPLYIDHCHETNNIRGLLCSKCNLALGLFQDNIENIERALAYLKYDL